MTDGLITRYDLDLMENRMVKDQWGGEWVRYSDHADEIARLNREIELLRVHRDIVWETPVGYWQDRAEKAEARVAELEAALIPLPDVKQGGSDGRLD